MAEVNRELVKRAKQLADRDREIEGLVELLNESQNQLTLAATQFGAKFAGGECLDLIQKIDAALASRTAVNQKSAE